MALVDSQRITRACQVPRARARQRDSTALARQEVCGLRLAQLEIQIPPKQPDDAEGESKKDGEPPPVFVIEELVADGAMLRIHPRNPEKDPLQYDMHELRVLSAGITEPMRFDALLDNAKPPGTIDTKGELPDGTTFEGIAGLRTLLLQHRAEYVRTFTEKLLAYALGRTVEYYDLPVIRKIAAEAAADDYRWSSVIAGVVKSMPFTMAVAHESEGAVQ